MSSEPARYDAIANWYIEFTKDGDSEPLALLPDDLRGLRVLDLACGYGRASRYLAQRGARVSGLDISAALLSRARQGGPEGSWSGLPSWPPEHGYSWEGRWSTNGKGIRDRAGVNHRMLSTYLNAVLRAGLAFEELAERGTSAPVTLIARCPSQG
jgi:SAM-dependent methyltransferase